MCMSIEQHYEAHLDTVKRRFNKALEATSCDSAIIYSGSPILAFQDDLQLPFKTNHHFKEWLPLTHHPYCFIVHNGGRKPQLIYYQPQDYWHVTPSAPSGFWVDRFDIQVVDQPDQAWELLPKTNTLWIGPEKDFGPLAPKAINPRAGVATLHYERAYKTDYEVACISRANEVGVLGHRAAKDAFYAGASEFEIHLAYLKAVGCPEQQLPYNNIIAMNDHSAVLHYDVYDTHPASEHHSFLIDAGYQHHGYAADITRTYSYDDVGFEDLVIALDASQQGLIEHITVGQSYADLHLDMHLRIGKILKDFDLVDMSEDAMVANNITGVFLPHGLGHHLGLCVHDVGGKLADRRGTEAKPPEGHPYLRNLRQIETGNVFTIEPGIYFIDMLLQELENSPHRNAVNWARVEHYKKFGGIRIEDNVWVSEHGTINLTRNAGI